MKCFIIAGVVLCAFVGGWYLWNKKPLEKSIAAKTDKGFANIGITVKEINEENLKRTIVADFTPLKLHFSHGYDASYSEGILSEDGIVNFYNVLNPKNIYGDSPKIEQKTVAPTSEDWKYFFELCEKMDLWNLDGKNFLPEEYYEEPIDYYRWKLDLEYTAQPSHIPPQCPNLDNTITGIRKVAKNTIHAVSNSLFFNGTGSLATKASSIIFRSSSDS